MKLFFLSAILAGSILLTNCTNQNGSSKSDECDSLGITKAILLKLKSKDFLPDTSGTYKEILSLFQIQYAYPPNPISEKVARDNHQRYLQSSKPITLGGQVIHYLNVSQQDLQTIWNNGTNSGARLYFSNESTGGFNITIVGVDNTGKNVLLKGDGTTAIVNKLQPCPDNCISGDYTANNDETDLNREYGAQRWYKPNKPAPAGKKPWWSQDNQTNMDQP
jgi:hypothetical protein